MNLLDVMSGKAEVGETVVICGNRKPGIGCALHLAKQGKKVTLVGKEKSPASMSTPPLNGVM